MPVPRQLPPDIAIFTGRAADLSELDDLLGKEPAHHGAALVITAVAGMPGTGKTALAVHWAHKICDLFPDGQLYANLRGYERGSPLSPGRVLEAFLRALGTLPKEIPHGLEAQAALFRTLAAGRRLLVVLDNARNADQVRPLLPGASGCLVVVTSRSRLSGLVARDGACRITLGALSEDEALALLAAVLRDDRVSSDPSGAAELARQCGYLPLALRIAADYAAARPHARLTDLAAELVGGTARLDMLSTTDDDATAVRSVFSWSYRALLPPTARAFRLLGLHTGPDISIPAAAALLGVSSGTARSLLDTLAGMHMLEQDSIDRYHFHDLLRDYAAEMAMLEEPEEERRNAIRGMLTWYQRVADAARQLLWPVGDANENQGSLAIEFSVKDDRQAIQWFDSELGNLVAVLRLAVEVGEDEFACRFPETLRVYFRLRMLLTEWVASCEIGLDAARRIHDRKAEGGLLGHLATCYFYLQRFEDSLQAREDSLAIFRAIGSRRDEAMGLMNLGGLYTKLSRREDAINCLQQSIKMARDIGDLNCEGHALENLGAYCASRKEYNEAISFLQQALLVFSAAGRSYVGMHGLGLVLYRLAVCYLSLHQYAESIAYCMKALEIQQGIRDRLSEAWTLDTQAKALEAIGEESQAVQAWERALAILDEIGHPDAVEIRARLAYPGPAIGQQVDSVEGSR
jgi:tetratricopeptide (TPR) repeat protein